MKIAVLIGGTGFYNQRRFINGILDTACADGTDVYIFTCDAWSYGARYKYEKGEYNIYNLPDFKQYDGVIIDTVTIHDLETVDHLAWRITKSGVPCVSLNDKFEGAINITVENSGGTRAIAEHLINEHNVGSIYYIAGPMDNPDAQERLEVYKSVMHKNKIDWQDDYIYYGDYTYRSGVMAAEHFLQMDRPLPEAIMAANDRMALGVIQKLSDEGFYVPDDVIVTGYDNSDMASLSNPRLTTVKKGMYAAAEMAYQKLKQVWQKEKPEDGVIYAQPIFSESCGCARRNYTTYEQVQDMYVRKQIEQDYSQTLLKNSSAEFTGVSRFHDLMVTLRKYIRLVNPEYFYFCINEHMQSYLNDPDRIEAGYEREWDTSSYLDEVTVPFAYERGKITRYNAFDTSLLLPPDRDKPAGAHYYVVFPLHYEDFCYGYCVTGNYKPVLERPLFQNFIMNLCNAMESIRKQEALKAIMEKRDRMWRNDELTGIYNRAGFNDEVASILERAEFKKSSISLFFIDTDGLKKVNDSFGHEAGDTFIKAMADILVRVCPSDYPVCRYGGDEFIILTTGLTEVETEGFKNKIKKAMVDYNESHSNSWTLNASIGYWFEQSAVDVDLNRLIELADQDMYKNKRKKKTYHDNKTDMAMYIG
ncbi:MAG: GGDEF domain-containing protein [Oscillospiraceae bacterium]|nr:GGDEF domain-containing protein [Oscillospiraceae bacterium]